MPNLNNWEYCDLLLVERYGKTEFAIAPALELSGATWVILEDGKPAKVLCVAWLGESGGDLVQLLRMSDHKLHKVCAGLHECWSEGEDNDTDS